MTRLLALLLCLAGPAVAQSDPALTAQRASAMLDAAATSLADADGARDRVTALTETVRAYEEGLAALRQGLRRAAAAEASLRAGLDSRRAELAGLLGALQAIERAPEPLLLLHPSGPVGAARSGMMLAEVTPAVAAEAQALRSELAEIAEMRAVQDDALARLEVALAGAQNARTELSRAIAERTDLPPRFETDAEAMSALLASADTLDRFAEGIRARTPPALADRPLGRFAAARGALDMPVLGRVLRSFGDEDAAGIARPGLLVATRPRALVIAPWPSTVRYAGPLLDLGNVAVLEPESDHLIILAGLGDLYVTAGDILPAGGPVGLMGGAEPASEELIVLDSQESGTSLPETLYIEVRQDGTPVDPETWFRTDRDED
ncbi:peptidase M23 [Rhodobacterales bacterium HKCCE3408]|nr:peptidase M23 [Rhodobacterales bacterium HKCCE3408]